MRIIAGEFRSRKLLSPPENAQTRPIPDRVKESLFSMLRGHTEGASVFDGFAGTGAVGLEAVSRGATRCIFVERDRRMAEVLGRNIERLGASDRCEVVVGDALGAGALARCPRPVTIVMLDPPYDLVRDPIGLKRVLAQMGGLVACLSDDGMAILRTPWPLFHTLPGPEGAPPEPGRTRRVPERRTRAAHEPARRPPGKGRWEEVWSLDRPGRHTDPGAAADALESAETQAPQAPVGKQITPELSVPGAKGPETHVYGTMALHLYMRAR